MDDSQGESRWADAALIASLIAIDPVRLGGVCLRAGHGAARDSWLALLRATLPVDAPFRRVPLHIATDRLLGGLDLTATLSAGRPVAQRGLLAESDGGFVVLPMAERFTQSTLAHITAALDTGEIVVESNGLAFRAATHFGVIALDEGISDEECARGELLDRLAFLLDFSGLRVPQAAITPMSARTTAEVRLRLPSVDVDAEIREALCATAMKLGIASIRASIMALRVACVLAAIGGRSRVDENDAATAARLVLATRATQLPEIQSSDEPSEKETEQDPERPDPLVEKPQDEEKSNDDPAEGTDDLPEDMILAAALAAIPKGLLAQLRIEKSRESRARSDGRAGALRQSLLRGRPAGVRRGEPRAGVRLNLIETLRAAAPWQPVRRAASSGRDARPIEIRREDFHVTRYKQRTQTTTIFIIDASGSSALNRLAEAKGTVELLLADCYVRRDQVAVIAFRGHTAELLLPPTRSLVRAKRDLAGMPGGSGTPLATAIDAGIALAEQVRRAGQTPILVLLTDGQANVALDGSGGRERGHADALSASRRLRGALLSTLLIDTSARAQPQAAQLATEMNARYLLLPYADAATFSSAIKNSLPSARS